jgi:hypothetical protein
VVARRPLALPAITLLAVLVSWGVVHRPPRERALARRRQGRKPRQKPRAK